MNSTITLNFRKASWIQSSRQLRKREKRVPKYIFFLSSFIYLFFVTFFKECVRACFVRQMAHAVPQQQSQNTRSFASNSHEKTCLTSHKSLWDLRPVHLYLIVNSTKAFHRLGPGTRNIVQLVQHNTLTYDH